MKQTMLEPPDALTSYVESFWTIECDNEATTVTIEIFANGGSGIVFQHHDGDSAFGPMITWSRCRHSFRSEALPTSFVYGTRTKPAQITAKGPFALTGVRFRPQTLSALLHIHPAQLTDAAVDLNELSSESVAERLLSAGSQQERLALLNQFLRGHVDRAQPEDVLVATSLRLIRRRIRAIRVHDLLTFLNVSERQFERRFVQAIGVSPHQYIRIMRFQEAVRLMKARQFERLSDVAYDLNYVDQSHLIKDIKAFSGHTPTNLSRSLPGVRRPDELFSAHDRRFAAVASAARMSPDSPASL
jgi:AraC-like DNA-binding protein